MPMFYAYCQNSAEHARLVNKVGLSMSKILKPALRTRCKFDGYRGSRHYYYFVNAIRVISYSALDSGGAPRYSGEYRRDYVYSDEEYNKDIFVDTTLYYVFMGRVAGQTDIFKKSFFTELYDKDRYKLDGIYINDIGSGGVMLKAGLKTGDIVSIDNRECFLIKEENPYGDDGCGFYAIAID